MNTKLHKMLMNRLLLESADNANTLHQPPIISRTSESRKSSGAQSINRCFGGARCNEDCTGESGREDAGVSVGRVVVGCGWRNEDLRDSVGEPGP